MTLTDSVQRFLSTKEVVILATLQPDGAPLAMPMWFLHDPGAITMISVADLQKVRNLRRDGRVCIAAETGTLGVTIQGTATFLSDTPERRTLADRFLKKYHPLLEQYWSGRAMPPNRVMFRITPTKIKSWGLD